LIKLNQLGTLTETLQVIQIARDIGYRTVISHRSGETNETILADLAVGLQIPIMKIGISGGERVSKINRLFEIVGE